MRRVLGKNVISLSKNNFPNLSTKSFKFEIKGKTFQGFVVKKEDKYYAYRNLCRHVPVTLDLNDNQFFTHDKSALQCSMHGAIYEIESGLCTEGPCQGAELEKLELEEHGNELIIEVPPSIGLK